jgi:putative membrane protein insertion efficiency factor
MSPMAKILLAAVELYRRIVSPLLPAHCRFHPSCSEYAVEALREHGAARGGWMALRRVGRCHPWNPGGIDPVPSKESGLVSPSRGA